MWVCTEFSYVVSMIMPQNFYMASQVLHMQSYENLIKVGQCHCPDAADGVDRV